MSLNPPHARKPGVPIPGTNVFEKLHRAQAKLAYVRDLTTAFQVDIEKMPPDHEFRKAMERVLAKYAEIFE